MSHFRFGEISINFVFLISIEVKSSFEWTSKFYNKKLDTLFINEYIQKLAEKKK